jgi:integrase
MNPQAINDTLRRIQNSYNSEEVLNAKKENREPVILPNFSCHHLRHTFATRLCETETNLKVIRSVMGHATIETTMDIYAEATDKKKQESFEILAERGLHYAIYRKRFKIQHRRAVLMMAALLFVTNL